MNPSFVLDAWAILALLQKEEPAASRVLQLLQESDVQASIEVVCLDHQPGRGLLSDRPC